MKLKKGIIILIVTAMMFTLYGCSGNGSPASGETEQESNEGAASGEDTQESDEAPASEESTGVGDENPASEESTKAGNESGVITIYFTRHGKTMLNTLDRSQGWCDAPLTPAGIEVAVNLGKGLVGTEFDKVYSSDSGRAIETAELVLANNGQEDMEIIKDKRLREFNYGSFEGMLNEEMWGIIAESQDMTLEEYYAYEEEIGIMEGTKLFTGILSEMDQENMEEGINWPAEDYDTIVARLKEAVDAIIKDAEKNGDEKILVVSHGMSITTLLYELDPSFEVPYGLKNASVSTLVYEDGAYSVTTVNDMSYVEKGAGE